MLVRQPAALLGLLSLAALSGCGSGGVGAGDVLVVAQVDIAPADLSLVAGSTGQLQATPKTSSGITVPNRAVSWSTDDPGIATISAEGVVTAVASGSTRVHATVDGVRSGVVVAVSPRPVATVTVVPDQVPLMVGETADLVVTPRDANSQPLTGRVVTFTSDNPLIATVSGDGRVVAIAPGLTVVRATVEDKVGTANIAVSGRPASQLDFQSVPGTAAAGTPLPGIRVEVLNDLGDAVTAGTMPVTIALGDNPTGAVLGGTKTVPAVNGVALFTDLTINHAGFGYTLVATSGALTPAVSAPFAIVAGSATSLGITVEPATAATSGAPLAKQPVIQIRDAAGNAVAKSGVQVTAALEGSGATLGGTRTVATDAEGVATFTNLTLTGSAGTYTLLFAAPSLTAIASTGITLGAGAPATLAIVQQPAAAAVSGIVLTRQPVIQVLDADGNPVPQSSLAVTAAIQGGAPSLAGTLTVATDANGRATFTNLSINGLIGTRTLRFSGGSLGAVTSEGVVVGPGAASALSVAANPPLSSSSGSVLTPAPGVQVVDAFGNAVDPEPEITVTVALASGPGVLSGTMSQVTATGAALFPNLVLTGSPGPYVLSFSGGGLTPAVSPPISIGAGAPAAVAMAIQPSASAASGSILAQQPVVQLRDASNNPAAMAGVAISVAIQSGGGTLEGTTTQVTNGAGQAAFTDLAITGTPGPRTLRFTGTGLTAATSGTVELTHGPPAKLVVATQPSPTGKSGILLVRTPVVTVTDAVGTGVPGATVTATINSGPAGGSLGGASAVTDNAGNAAFPALTITGSPGDYTLRFTADGLTALSDNVTLMPDASRLLLPTQPSATANSGVALPTAPVVQLAATNGAAVAEPGVTVTAVIASGPSGGTLQQASATTDAAGRAQFTGLAISGTTGNYTLRFESDGLTPVTSQTVALAAGLPALLSMQAQPPLAAVNDAVFSNNVVVRVQDASGNDVPGAEVTARVATGAGIVQGTVTRVASGTGRATFNDLELVGTIGNYTLEFSAAGASVLSRSITLLAGARAVLAVQVEPSITARSGVNFATQPRIELRDTGGNLVSNNNVQILAALVTVSGVGSLGGDISKNTNGSGVATFTNLRITGSGTFQIRFTSSGMTSVNSVEITVTLF